MTALDTARGRLEHLAREHPDVLQEARRQFAALTDDERSRLAALTDSARTAAFKIIQRDGASVDVAIAAVTGDTGTDA